MYANLAIWIIAVLSTAGVIIRPFRIPEAVWAVSGAVLLTVFRLLLPAEAWKGIASGADVYFFLTGMMLLAELAREEKLFDWLAAYATNKAKGSGNRLFMLVYLVGTAVTIFLSNDATAVVLTPAVAAAMKAAKIAKPLPYLLSCAFVANAASFVLPISNPANLVIYGAHMPPLLQWLSAFVLPSAAAIVVTFLLLRWLQRKTLQNNIECGIALPLLGAGGKLAAWGIAITAVALLTSSACNIPLGLPTLCCGLGTTVLVLVVSRKHPVAIIKGISWSVLPLVAGLFVIVEALNKTGLIRQLGNLLQRSASHSTNTTAWTGGVITGIATNLTNNLPAGLVAGQVIQRVQVSEIIRRAILIGVDLGPNLSVTGSLATILWLVALRREGIEVSAGYFLRQGLLVMTLALIAAIALLWL